MRRKILIIMGVLLFLIGGIILYDDLKIVLDYKEFDNQQEILIDTYLGNIPEGNEQAVDADTSNTYIPDLNIDFEALQATNPDIIGWIYIPGTNTNNPILLGDDDTEYLHRNYKNQYQYMGSIYAHYRTSPLLNDPYTVLFGHNMRSGRMFGDLSNYESESFREQYPYVYIYTPEKSMQCTVYACSYVQATDPDIYSYGHAYETESFRNLIDKTIYSRLYDCNIIPTEDDQIFCLSTCTDSRKKTERFVVQCVVTCESPSI